MHRWCTTDVSQEQTGEAKRMMIAALSNRACMPGLQQRPPSHAERRTLKFLEVK